MKQINVGIIGTGWCGGIRANSCAHYPSVNELHIAETNAERRAEVEAETGAVSAVADYQELLKLDAIDMVIISATPEKLVLGSDIVFGGTPPNLYRLPPGCHYVDRCPLVSQDCAKPPVKIDIGDGHLVACHHVDKTAAL